MIKKLKLLLPVITMNFLTIACAQTPTYDATNNFIQDCGLKPNCVSTKATRPSQQIKIINYTGSPDNFKAAALNAIKQMPRFKIVNETTNSIAVEFTSFFFRFTDDFNINYNVAEGAIHMRSASRVGHSDFGVNLKRTELFRSLFSAP